MLQHTILAANEYYRIEKHTFKPSPLADNFIEEYLLMDWSDDTAHVFNTLEELQAYIKDNGLKLVPKLNTVSYSIVRGLETELFRTYRDTSDDMIRINLNIMESQLCQEPLRASINWSCIGDTDPETALKFATQLQAAANYAANEFPYKGLIVVFD